jgi:hypothetical protein
MGGIENRLPVYYEKVPGAPKLFCYLHYIKAMANLPLQADGIGLGKALWFRYYLSIFRCQSRDTFRIGEILLAVRKRAVKTGLVVLLNGPRQNGRITISKAFLNIASG